MSLESFNFIDSLNASNPTTTDNVSEGDDHIRGIKSTLKTTFPSINAAITATDEEINLLDGVTATTAELNTLDGITSTVAELNYVDGVTSNIQTQLGTKLPLAGGTMTGNITLGTNTIDGLEINTTDTSNLGLGTGAVDSITTGDYNVGVGDNALSATTSGHRNSAFGYQAMVDNTTGYYNSAIGYQSLANNITGIENTAVGWSSLLTNVSGGNNTAVGSVALYSNTGSSNTAIGMRCMADNTTGNNNTSVGSYALNKNTTGANNTASGFRALLSNTTGASNTVSGYQSMYSNTTGYYNVSIGTDALKTQTSATQNVAVGYHALRLNTSSISTAVGGSSLANNSSGSGNAALGWNSLNGNTTGSSNTAVGTQAAQSNTTGSNNTAMGYQSLLSNTTGANNTALGYGAGDNITTGSSNIIIGAEVDAPSATASNQLNIGGWITGAAGAITVPGSLTTAGFTSTGIDDNATSTAITIDASENVGIGVTPKAWGAAYSVTQLGGNSSIAGYTPIQAGNVMHLYQNAYDDGTVKYISTDEASNYYQLSGKHIFRVAPSGTAGTAITWTTPLTIANTGDVTVGTGNLVIGTSGKGIDFSATSDGSGTMTSEVLDDYEEGTWTPALSGSVTAGSTTYLVQVGKYEKIGRQVTIRGRIAVNLKGTLDGAVSITGLPYTSSASSGAQGILNFGYASNLGITASESLTCLMGLSATTGGIKIWNATTGTSNLDDSEIGDAISLYFEGSYHVD